MFRYFVVLGLYLISCSVCALELEVRDGWIPEAPPVARSHVAYMELINNSDEAVQLISAFSEDYGMAMFHQTSLKDGVSSMTHLDVLTIEANSSIKLEPGGTHLMLMQPKKSLKAGDPVLITLCFSRDEHQEIKLEVRKKYE